MINKIAKLLFVGVCSAFLVSCGGDDDEPAADFIAEVSVTAPDASGKEGDNNATFSIQLSKENTSGKGITVAFSLAGTATAGEDYTLINNTFTVTLLEISTTYYFKVFPIASGTLDNSQPSQSESTVTCSTSGTTANEVCFDISSDVRTITSNQYPNHTTGTFPNADVTVIALSRSVDLTPASSGSITYVYDETSGPGPSNRNFFEFGVASNGIGYDPMGLKPWTNPDTGEENWAWQAKVTDEGETHLDAYGGHVTSAGKYHYHGDVSALAAGEDGTGHSRIYGFAADGFPIYYKYGYSNPNDATSTIAELQSSYQLKSGSSLVTEPPRRQEPTMAHIPRTMSMSVAWETLTNVTVAQGLLLNIRMELTTM